MIILLLLSLFLPIVTWFIIIHLYVIRNRDFFYSLFKICLALGLGFGSSSVIFFLWLSFIGPSVQGIIFGETGALLGLFFLLTRKREAIDYPDLQPPQVRKTAAWRPQRLVPPVFLAILLVAFLGAVYRSLNGPHGPWDAWAVWNMHARFLFMGGDHSYGTFAPLLNNPDYPLLTPAFIARCWSYYGTDTVAVPIIVALSFTFALVGLVVSAVAIFRGKIPGCLAGLALLGTLPFLFLGLGQYADVPLGFFFFATIALVSLQEEPGVNKPGVFLLAGLAAGLGSWTKNEGIVFLLAIFLARLVVGWLIGGWRRYFTEIRYFMIGLVPGLLTLGYFKLAFAPPNWLTGQTLAEAVTKLFIVSRYLYVAKELVLRVFLNRENYDVPIGIILTIYFFLMGAAISEKNRPIILTGLIACGFMMFGYSIVIIINPLGFITMLPALPRIALQIWPILIFLYFLTVHSPEELVLKNNL